jgi:hypothetical protein
MRRWHCLCCSPEERPGFEESEALITHVGAVHGFSPERLKASTGALTQASACPDFFENTTTFTMQGETKAWGSLVESGERKRDDPRRY